MPERFNWRDAILAAGTLALLALFAVAIETVVVLRHLDQDRAAGRRSLSGTTDLLRHRIEAVTYSFDRATGKLGDIEADIKKETESRETYDKRALALLDKTKEDLGKAGDTLDSLKTAAGSVSQLVSHTDEQLNGKEGLLPSATMDLRQLDSLIGKGTDVATHTDQIVTGLGPQLQATAEHTASTAKNVDATTFDIQQYVHRITRPGKAVWGVIKEALGIGSSAGNIKRGLF